MTETEIITAVIDAQAEIIRDEYPREEDLKRLIDNPRELREVHSRAFSIIRDKEGIPETVKELDIYSKSFAVSMGYYDAVNCLQVEMFLSDLEPRTPEEEEQREADYQAYKRKAFNLAGNWIKVSGDYKTGEKLPDFSRAAKEITEYNNQILQGLK